MPPYTTNLSTSKLIKQTLLDQYLQTWNAQLQDSSKGRSYSLFKQEIKLENYIFTLNGPLLFAMIRFRTANHKMPIETGRWNQIDLPERKCQLCDKNDLGDEYHYLFICPFFRNERAIFIDRHFRTDPNILKYKELLQIKDNEKLIKLGKFMRIIMKAHN